MPPELDAEYQLNLDRSRVDPLGDVLRLWFAEGVRLLFGPVVEALKTAPPLKIVSENSEPEQPGKMYGQVKLDRHVDGRIRRSRKVYSDKNLEAFLSNLDGTMDHADVSLIHMDDTRDGCRLSASSWPGDANLIRMNCYMPVTWLEDPAYEGALLEFARTTAGVANPLYGQIGYYRATFDTAFSQRLAFNLPDTVAGTEAELCGYDWLTIVPETLGQKLGGHPYFAASPAFTEVAHLDRGGYFLLATPTFAEYGMGAAEKVFEVIAPLLRGGMPYEPSPLRAPTYIVMRDAAEYRDGVDAVRSE
jgi:hypothetical protein